MREDHARSLFRHVAMISIGAVLGVTGIALVGVNPSAAAAPIFQMQVTSTVPANGDVNPYGVAVVPKGFPGGGTIAPGDILVSNFNNSANLQGTGTTIISFTPQANGPVAPNGKATTFFQGQNGLGLTTALGVLRGGFVVVGNTPTTDGTFGTIQSGSLLFLDRSGNVVLNYTQVNGPWDLTLADRGNRATVFLSNVLDGTVTRLQVSVGGATVSVVSNTTIATGYTHQPNKAALVLGPTGLAYDGDRDVLYVASTADNAIYAIRQAGMRTGPVNKGMLVFQDSHLRGPLALAFTSDGTLMTANGDAVNGAVKEPSEIVQFTTGGKFLGEFNVDSGQGGAFGLAFSPNKDATNGLNFAFIDDNTTSLIVTNFGN